MLLSTWFDNGLGKRFGSKTPMLAGSLLVLRLRNRQNAAPLSPLPAPAASPASPPPSASSSGGAEAVGAALTPEEAAINSGLQISSFGRGVHGKDKERSEGIRINDEYDRLRVEIENRQGPQLSGRVDHHTYSSNICSSSSDSGRKCKRIKLLPF